MAVPSSSTDANPMSARQATALLAALIAIMPFAIDVYLPALGAIARDLGSTVHHLEQTMGSFFIGTAIGQLIGAPVSDRYGRRPPILIGLVIFGLASLRLAYIDDHTSMVVWRLIQALGSGVAVVNAAAIVKDLFDEVETARLFASIAVVMMIAPLVSPLIGAYLLEAFGWSSIFIFLAVYAVIVIGILYKLLPETRHLRRQPIAANGYSHVLALHWSNMLVIALSFSSLCFFLYIADASFIFLEYYQLSPTQFAWLFGAGVVVLVLAHRVNHVLLEHYKPRRILMYCVPAQLVMALCVYAYTWLGPANMWLMYAFIMSMGGLTQIISSNGLAMFLTLHPDHTGKANAILGSARFGLAGIFGFALSFFHAKHPITFATLIVSASIISNIFFWYCRTGSDLFNRSKTH